MDSEERESLIINELLCFVQSNISLFSRNVLVKCLRKFYSIKDSSEAMDVILMQLSEIQAKDCLQHLNECHDSEQHFIALLNLFQILMEKKNPPIFLCRDLSKVPQLLTVNDIQKSICQSKKKLESSIQELVLLKENLQLLLLSEKRRKDNNSKNKGLNLIQQYIDEDFSDINEEEVSCTFCNKPFIVISIDNFVFNRQFLKIFHLKILMTVNLLLATLSKLRFNLMNMMNP